MADGAIPAFLKPVSAAKPPPAFLKPLDEPPPFLQPTAPPVEPVEPQQPILDLRDERLGLGTVGRVLDAALYGTGETFIELGKGLGSGAVRGTAGILSGAAKLDPLEAYAENIEPFRAEMARVPSMSEDELASLRSRVGEIGTLGSEQFLQTLISDLRDGSVLPEELDTQFGPPPTPVQERRPYQAGTSLIEFADKNLAPGPNTPGIVRMGAEAIGSTLPYLIANLLVPGGGTITGMIGGSGEETRRAIEAGATPEQVTEASGGGVLGGSTEALPLELLGKNFLNFLPPWARIPGQIAVTAAAESGQEVLQTGIGNVTQSYEPERPFYEGMGESAAGGGIAGAFMELITRMLMRRGAGPGPAPAPAVQPALPAITPDQIPPVPPAPVPPGPPAVATQVLPTGTETTPTVQPNVPGPGPSVVVPALPVTEQIPPKWTPQEIEERVAALMQSSGLPPGEQYDKAAAALRDQFIDVNQQDQQIRAAAAVSAATQPPAPSIPPAGTLTAGTQVLPTNVPPAPPALAPTEPPGEAAAPAPEAPLPVAEPPKEPPPFLAPVPTGPVEPVVTTPPAEQPAPTAPVPPAPPAAEPEEDIPVPEEILGPKPQGAQDLRSFIRSQGGIQPTGDLRTAAERYPNIVNKEGKTAEHIRERMAEAGYFGDADAMASTTPADATDMIRDALGGRDIYPSRAADQADQEALDQWNEKVGQLEDIGSLVNDAIKESGRTDITNKEIRQMIGRAFSSGDPELNDAENAAAAVDFVLARRPEPKETEGAKPVETEEGGETVTTPVPEDQLFIPGTERKEAAGQQVATGDALGKALARDKAAVAENTGVRYSIGPAPGEGGVHLTITKPGQKPEVGWHPNEEHAITGAKLDMADRTKRVVKARKQQGVEDLGIFKTGRQTDIEEAPAAKPVAKKEEPAPEPAAKGNITDEAKAVVRKFDEDGKKTKAFESLATPEQASMYNRVAKAIKDLGDKLTAAGVDLTRSGGLKPMSQASEMDKLRSGMSGAFSRYMNQVISTGRGYKTATKPEVLAATIKELSQDLAQAGEFLAQPMEPIDQRAPAAPPKFDTLPAAIDPADIVQVSSAAEAKAALLAGKPVVVAGTTHAVHKLVPAPDSSRGEAYALYKGDGTPTLLSYVRDRNKAPWTREQAAENASKGMFLKGNLPPRPAPVAKPAPAAEPTPEVTYRVASQEGRYVVLANEVPVSKLFGSRGTAMVHMRRLERGETGEEPAPVAEPMPAVAAPTGPEQDPAYLAHKAAREEAVARAKADRAAGGGGDLIGKIMRSMDNEGPLEERSTGPALPDNDVEVPELWGEDAYVDDEIVSNDEADVVINSLEDRNRRAGETPTFKDVSMTDTTPLNPASAYLDAGLSPDDAMIMSPEGRFQALATLFRQKFGFKTVSRVGTYGKANALEAIDALMDGYRGVRAMMHILGLPTTGASLGGRLSFTIGRKTGRSAFLGVYNPEDQSIELVGRSNGFAHEWMHALDHWLLDTVFGPIVGKAPILASKFTRDRGLDPTVTLEDHFIQVMNAIFFNDAALAARVLDLQIKASRVYGPKHPDATKRGLPTREALDAQRMLEDIAAGRSKLGIKQKSDYYKTSRDFGKGQDSYWTDPAELLARAFEAYVAWRMNVVDPTFANNFMTKGDAAYLNGADDRLAKTFPHDPDRMRIFGAIEVMMGAVMSQTSIGMAPAGAMPGGAELIQDDVFYAHAAEQERQNRAKANQRNQLGRLKNRLLQATNLAGWNEMYNEAADSLDRRFGSPQAILSTMQSLGTSFRGMMFTEAAVANHLIERPQSKNAREYLHAIGSQLFELAPGRGDFVPETWTEAVIAFTRIYAGKLENILDRHNIPETVPRNPKTQQGMAEVGQRNRLYEILTTGHVPAGTSQSEVAAAAAIRAQIFDEIYRDARRAGLDIGYLEDAPYLPVIPDPFAIHNDMEGYIAAATELYQTVYDRAIGVVVGNSLHVDPTVLQNAINDLKKWNGTDSGLGDPDIVRLRAQASRQLKQIRTLRASLTSAPDPVAVQDQIDTLSGQLQGTWDELSGHVGGLWAETKAHRWHEAFIRGEYSAMDTLGPQTKHTKTRVLPSESQKIMQAFVVNDPIEAATIYINSMARKIEYSSRFGQQSAGNKDLEFLLNRPNSPLLAEMKARGLDRTKARDRITAIMELTNPNKDNRLEMLFLEAQRAGAVTSDLKLLRNQVEYMTGRRSENAAIMRELSNAIYVAGSLALMPRSAWTSMTEPVTALARTGDVAVAGKTLAYYMKEFFAFNGTTVADVHDISKAIGMIASETQEVMLQSTMGDIPMNSKLSRFMAAFYERIQLAPLTRMQTRTGVIGYHVWLKKLLRMALGTTGKRAAAGDAAVARANLRELGINDHQVQPMWDFLAGRGIERIMSRADANTPMGRLWAVGQRRYAHSVVQQGTKATSTRLSSHPMGRLVMGLMRFAYTFTRNILIRPIRQATRDERLRIEAGENRHAAAARAFRDNLLYRMGIGFGALWLGHLLIGMVRSFLFDREQFEKHIEESDFFQWQGLIALSRTGVFGALDPLVQAWKGLRYQRDLTSVTSGAFLNVGLNWLQSLGNLSANNSPNTNTTERNFVQDSLRMYQTPLVMAFLNALPGGRAAGFMYGVLGMVASSNSVISYETDWIAGEKRDTSPKGRAGQLDLRDRPKMR